MFIDKHNNLPNLSGGATTDPFNSSDNYGKENKLKISHITEKNEVLNQGIHKKNIKVQVDETLVRKRS